ncbi:MAG: agmatine deiminase family protein [Polyangiaceae bacterium]
MTTPRDHGFHAPAEWARHAATWVAWPSHADLWQHNLAPARAAFTGLVSAIAEGETAEVLVPDDAQEKLARAALPAAGVRFHRVPFGDIWLRDTAPVFLVGPGGTEASVRFVFNGWGGKYVLEHDSHVSERVASLARVREFVQPTFVLEGGAIDVDGEGSVLTTRQCMMNPNRNGSVDAQWVERMLRQSLGVDAVLWLGEGLANDHTDGHVDTIVRFVRPGVVVAMEPRAPDDPNREVLQSLLAEAAALVDARGRKLEVVRIPSPGRVEDEDGRVMPASYVNFYIANAAVVVPTYGTAFDAEAVELVGALFPGRRSIGVDARAVLTGGGAFHCITQQQPMGGAP